MKILVVAPQPFFSYRGTPFSVYYRTLVMAEQGGEIDLLTYGQGMDVDIPGVRILRIPAFHGLGPIPIGPSKFKVFLDAFLVLRLISLLIWNRYKVVHAHEEAVFFCTLLKPIFRFRMIYDMHSSLPQQLTNFQFTRSRFLISLFKWLEEFSLRQSEAVITICPDLAQYVLENTDEPEKHFLIENSIFEPVRLKDTRGTAASESLFTPIFTPNVPGDAQTLVYAGTLETYQGIDILIDAFGLVRQQNPQAFLMIVGGTKKQVEKFREYAGEELLQHMVLHEQVSQISAKTLCAAANVQLSPRRSGTNTPLKVYEQLASGVPLVATDIYSHTQVLSSDVAYLVKPEPHDMARGILEALADGKDENPKARAAKKLYEEKYSRPVYEEKMRRLLARIGSCAA